MSSHTPGPWVINHVPTSAGSAYRIGQAGLEKGCAWIYADGIRKGIDDQLPRAIELAANARLIAAAPELLDALKALVFVCGIELADLGSGAYLAGLAAIDKATRG